MMDASTKQSLRANTRFLVEEMEQRGVDVELIDWRAQVVCARLGEHREWIYGIDTSATPLAIGYLMDNKLIAKRLLQRAGLAVPRGERFTLDDSGRAYMFVAELGYPVVFKPCRGAIGELVVTDIGDIERLESAIDTFHRAAGTRLAFDRSQHDFIVEQQFEGEEIRVFVTRDGDYAAVHRASPAVTGDGKRTIKQLAADENTRRAALPPSSLAPLVVDAEVRRFLAALGLALDSIPGASEVVRLRRAGSLALGAACDDCTDLLHPSALELAHRALAAFDAPFAGVDFLCKDFTRALDATNYVITEVNSNPSYGMHVNPGTGRRRNAVAPVIDMIFPETRVFSRTHGLRAIDAEPPFA